MQSLRNNRHELIPLSTTGLDESDFRLFTAAWRKLVISESINGSVTAINRRYFELAVLYRIRDELKSGDLYVQYGERYDDYREQLVDDITLNKELAEYGLVTGIDTDPKTFSKGLKNLLSDAAEKVDAEFPKNAYAEIVDDRLILKKAPASGLPPGIRQVD
ncbi:hypothetical protein MTYM_02380 [Methylococcales bacterium]|nr:hypothetical protein MTYM_02380 [Methylococcales bacterium]